MGQQENTRWKHTKTHSKLYILCKKLVHRLRESHSQWWTTTLHTLAVDPLTLCYPLLDCCGDERAPISWDFQSGVDMEYTWKCNPNKNQCEDTNDVTKRDWVIFIILMIVFLLKDLVSGLKMIKLSGKKRHSKSFRARLFSGGVILCCITMVRYAYWVCFWYLSCASWLSCFNSILSTLQPFILWQPPHQIRSW